MKILTPSYKYELANFDNPARPGQIIQFIEKAPVPVDTKERGFVFEVVNDGTTNEEVLMVLIDRLKGLGKKLPCRENSIAVTKCEEALMWLEARSRDRKNRNVEGTMQA